ncbi:MAG: CoA transferase [Nitrososphaeria archaeon]|nr:CoA transferase [Nitrososphaeria archaeon]
MKLVGRSVDMGELNGVRVLDLSRALAGPFCSMMLGDMGADVIKVERPGLGDDSRAWGPPFIRGESAYFLSLNRNKRSITLNLKKPEALEILYELVQSSDVFLENFRPGVTERLNIDYKTVKEINSEIVYCSISGFGSEGLYRDRAGLDIIIQGMAGLMSVTGEEERPPVKVGVAIADLIGGFYATIMTTTALLHRARTGKGQQVEVSLLEGTVSIMTHMAHIAFATGETPKKLGTAHAQVAPYQSFMAGDGKYLSVGVPNERLWAAFCEATGLMELLNHPSFNVNAKRVQNRAELIKIIQEKMLTKSQEEWIEIFDRVGLPTGPVYDLVEVYKDPHIIHRGMIMEMEHHKAGRIKQIGVPMRFSETPCSIRIPPPTLGQHNEEILRELLDLSREKIEALREGGII